MADIFDVIADSTRRDILTVLLDRTAPGAGGAADCSVSEIVAELGLSQPTVSKHLRVLREAGVVAAREEGQRRFYRVEPGPLATVGDWIARFDGGSRDDVAAAPAAGSAAGSVLSEGARQRAEAMGRSLAEARYTVTDATSRIPRPSRRG